MKLHTLICYKATTLALNGIKWKTFDIKIMTFPPPLETLGRLLHEVKIDNKSQSV